MFQKMLRLNACGVNAVIAGDTVRPTEHAAPDAEPLAADYWRVCVVSALVAFQPVSGRLSRRLLLRQLVRAIPKS